MKRLYKISTIVILIITLFPVVKIQAGNEDRSGQAGASELLINPWARSSGWGGANSATVHGLEAIYMNVAGTAFTKKTELIFSRTNWLQGSGVKINNFGLSQRLSETGVLSFSIMSMSFGELLITTVDLPEGGIGTFSPNLMNISISYAKTFSNSIYGGIAFKIISESISDVSAQGIAIDAGIQYVTGETENIKFGIAMKNVGPRMMFKGDGLSFRGYIPGNVNQFTVEQRSAQYELPSLINIGAAYDFNFNESNKLTAAANFTSNSFTKDQYIFGLEYNFKNYLMIRGGYAYEKGITEAAERTTAYTGPCGGFTVDIPLNKEKGSTFGIDYSYRDTNPFEGTHSIGVRISL
ncbi:MAG TPA: PorV/PorQ family protein [Bacteroidales bacterium]|nr:PorV/PorQ family protein [Bacteroidales bacterium]HPS15823.1 PorV/PorQ family protein [Bacteroidales bacterium]